MSYKAAFRKISFIMLGNFVAVCVLRKPLHTLKDSLCHAALCP
jgi:hypothetical protein